MKTLTYVIQDEQGIHARPAGLLVKEMQKFSSTIMITKGEKKADGKKLFAIMGMAAKKGEELVVTIEGDDEDAAYEATKEFLSANL